MGKIQIDEERLHKIVEEEVNKYIAYKIALNEYAISRKDFIDKKYGKMIQIIENLALLGYYYINATNCPTLRHWCEELISHAADITETALKNGNNDTKKKALIEIITNNNLLDSDTIIRIFARKFKVEGIRCNKVEAESIAEYVYRNMIWLIDAVSFSDKDDVIAKCRELVDDIELIANN